MRRMIGATALAVALVTAGCDSTTAPSSSTATTTDASVATPTITDVFTGTLEVGSTVFFTFDVIANGTVNATVSSISGAGVPSTVQVRLGLGTIADDGACTASAFSSSAFAGSTAPVTSTFAPGTYCVSIADVGNLFRRADFSLSVAHS